MQLAAFISAPFGQNAYVAHLSGRDDCVVIDPGFEVEPLLEYIEAQRLTPAAVLNTHGHVDHIAGNAAVKKRWPNVPLVIGRNDEPKLSDARLNLSAKYGFSLVSPPADLLLDDGQTYAVAGFEFDIREIPGHSIGHIVFIDRGRAPTVVFGGDVLFAGGVGRTDFPDGSMEQLRDGIERHLFTLPDATIVYSGHGPSTTVGDEKRTNPFVGRGV
jgi:glyoxylase-like metal-dependent hydrolase (beta-lactamase superfamily II)